MAAGVAGGPTTGRNRRAARRSEEQVEVMHALWAEPHVTFKGKWHTRSRTPASTRGQRARRVRPAAHPDRAGRPRARRGRDRGLGLDGFWNGSGLGEGDPVLERSRLFARDPDDELQSPPPPPHPRPHDGRPPDGAAALSCRGRGPALDEEGPRVRIPVLRQRLRLSSGSIKISSSADF